nr:hypothetical protein Iba_chr05dCG12820 [Ipomoea batatas]
MYIPMHISKLLNTQQIEYHLRIATRHKNIFVSFVVSSTTPISDQVRGAFPHHRHKFIIIDFPILQFNSFCNDLLDCLFIGNVVFLQGMLQFFLSNIPALVLVKILESLVQVVFSFHTVHMHRSCDELKIINSSISINISLKRK